MLKRTLIFALAFGAAFAVVGILGLLGVFWYTSRPKSWDTKSITCVSSTATQIFLPPEISDHKSGFSFKFVLVNDSDRNYTVPKDVKLLTRSAQGEALADIGSTTSIAHPVLIPAKERAELEVTVEFGCYTYDAAGHGPPDDPEKCFQSFLSDSIGYVALDDVNRIRIDLPKPSWQSPQGEAEAWKGPLFMQAGPDKGDSLDRSVACGLAAKLVNLCKRTGIAPSEQSFGSLPGGYADDLKSIPIPPQGYKLTASQATCDTAYEWKNYCQDHKK